MEREENRKKGLAATWKRFVPNWYLCILATFLIVIGVILVSLVLLIKHTYLPIYPKADAVECPGLSHEECHRSKGCVYKGTVAGPSCVMRDNAFGYKVEKVSQESDGPKIDLKRMVSNTPYGPSIEKVVFKLTYLTENILRFQLKDADSKRYEVPVQKEFSLLKVGPKKNITDKLEYEIIHTNETEIFHFAVKRKNGTYLWDTRIGALLMSDKFLQIGSYVPTKNVYGIGEHAHDTLRHDMNFVSWPLFAGDEPPEVPTNRKNLYGVHPFYTCLETNGKSHGVFFLNSNAMEVTFLPAPAVTFRTIGGILDFFIFVGNNPEHVIQLYTSLIGRPMLPPYWALGFQLSKYGYGKIETLQSVMNRNKEAKIPVAVQHLDIDHMNEGMDFTYNNQNFKGLSDLVNKTQNEGLKWIVIQEPFIAVNSKHYTSGTNKSVFVKRSPSWKEGMFPKDLQKENITFGKVWPTHYVAFLDFFKNETKAWWKEQLKTYYKEISFDGLWIDMNEPANFGTNENFPEYCMVKKRKPSDCWSLMCPDSPYENPPYNPLESTGTKKLSRKTICMKSVQGDSSAEYLHYDVHSLYGWSQTLATLEAVQEITESRSLVIPRSTYPSTGGYAGHWLGDNKSTYKHMEKSIIGMLEFNLFGIPYVGADVCGFHGNADEDLCKRWMQLGAFYPYYRNHNGLENDPQDPAWYGDKEKVITYSRKAIERRIKLNPHLYTLFYKAHTNGNTVVRPVFHEFPEDETTWDLAIQFMWGKSIMVVPVLEADEKAQPVYFPKDEWWHFKELSTQERDFQERYVIELDADEYTPLYIRGGTILPYGNYDWNNYAEKNTTTRNITLYVFPKSGNALGDLFMDDGVSKDTIKNEAYATYEFQYKNCSLKVTTKENKGFKGIYPYLENVVFFRTKDFANVTGGYKYEYYTSCKCVLVNVNTEMKKVEEFSWNDSKGTCPESK